MKNIVMFFGLLISSMTASSSMDNDRILSAMGQRIDNNEQQELMAELNLLVGTQNSSEEDDSDLETMLANLSESDSKEMDPEEELEQRASELLKEKEQKKKELEKMINSFILVERNESNDSNDTNNKTLYSKLVDNIYYYLNWQ